VSPGVAAWSDLAGRLWVQDVAVREAEIARRDRERSEAVALRDTTIDQLRSEQARLTRNWRRFIVGPPRV
jgi:hypothetical protein